MHKKWMTSLAVAALLALSAAGSADDSEDYENALRHAEQGNANAQFNLGLMYGEGLRLA
jgi:TPR repeat protein